MATSNGAPPRDDVHDVLDDWRLGSVASSAPTLAEEPVDAPGSDPDRLTLPPARWSPRVSLAFAILMTTLVCAWWGLLAIPRADEFNGAAEQSGGGGAEITSDDQTTSERTGGGNGEIIFVLAAISVLVTLGAVGVRAMSLSVIQQAIEEEDEAAVEAREHHREAVREAGVVRKMLQDTTCAIDSVPVQVAAECEAQEQAFWEGWHERASNRPDRLGTWETLEQRKEVAGHTIAELWGAPTVPDTDGIKRYIAERRAAARSGRPS